VKKRIAHFILFLSLSVSLNAQVHQPISIPLGGNSWATSKSNSPTAMVTDSGWINWKTNEDFFNTYVKLSRPGSLDIWLVLEPADNKSNIKCSVNGQSKSSLINKNESKLKLGTWKIESAGYIKIEINGLSKEGSEFARVKDLQIAGSAVDSLVAFVRNNQDNYFYWGKRGPSVHCNYDVSTIKDDVEWFYNEVTVPPGNDPVGTYAMAIGFGEGYFGIQVNSDSERRILFSVWSPYETDNPNDIPEDKRILLLKKGEQVHTGEFGSEGSGGQSYLHYNWKAGNNYKFLVRIKPEKNNHSSYTAYFFDNEKNKWRLIASFSRPSTSTYITRPHSFLENFEPEQGYKYRKALYSNTWAITKTGLWIPITKMTFTGDATAKKGYRMDYGGGAERSSFFLHNGGFFSNETKLKSIFSIQPKSQKPKINFENLER